MKKQREIVVSALGQRPMMDKPFPDERSVTRMIEFWRGNLAAVLPDHPDLIVVYEDCDNYPLYTTEESLAYYECRGERIRDFFAEEARANHCYIAYCAYRSAGDGSWRNCMELIGRNGECAGTYNKNYPVPEETLLGRLRAGREAHVLETDFGKVAMVICFDLNFVELLEKYREQQPDLILFSSVYHGGLMQKVWASRCDAYFIGAVCDDECSVVNPLGETVALSSNYFSHVTAALNLDYQVLHLDGNRKKLEAAKLRYGRDITVFDPGHLGRVLLTSRHPERSSAEIAAEFDMELWRDYYRRSREHRRAPGVMEEGTPGME